MKWSLLLFWTLVEIAYVLGGDLGSLKGKPNDFDHDIKTQAGLTKLYNQKVVHCVEVRRPMKGVPIIRHFGLKVKTEDGGEWLIHKGPDYGDRCGDNVVVNARHMDKNTWYEVKGTSGKVTNSVTVGQLVKSAQGKFSYIKNCINAVKIMKELLEKNITNSTMTSTTPPTMPRTTTPPTMPRTTTPSTMPRTTTPPTTQRTTTPPTTQRTTTPPMMQRTTTPPMMQRTTTPPMTQRTTTPPTTQRTTTPPTMQRTTTPPTTPRTTTPPN